MGRRFPRALLIFSMLLIFGCEEKSKPGTFVDIQTERQDDQLRGSQFRFKGGSTAIVLEGRVVSQSPAFGEKDEVRFESDGKIYTLRVDQYRSFPSGPLVEEEVEIEIPIRVAKEVRYADELVMVSENGAVFHLSPTRSQVEALLSR